MVEDISNSLEDRVNPRLMESAPIQRCSLGTCHGACCIFGVWVDKREKEEIIRNSALIAPTCCRSCVIPRSGLPVSKMPMNVPQAKVSSNTAVETQPEHYGGTACIFWRLDGKCALQVAGVEMGCTPGGSNHTTASSIPLTG